MAKRKNPLKDLDSFLKQEAASIVTPNQVNVTPAPQEPVQETPTGPSGAEKNMDANSVITYLEGLHGTDPKSFRTTLYHIIQKSLENTGLKNPSDKMLLNTILYLDNPADWKEAIKAYWKTK